MRISCAFAPSLATPDHIALAEELGYERAWVYDSPAAYADCWMVLALAAQRTSRIGLGPAVLVPGLRHPVTNAGAIATLAGLAPGRVGAAFGTGLTGRMLVGERPHPWRYVADYVAVVRRLLAGEEATWEDRVLRLVQPEGFAASRPVDVTLLVGAEGPKGTAVADELGDGVFAARLPAEPDDRNRSLLVFGTVLDEGEELSSPRVVAAAGPALVVAFHTMYEAKGPAGVERLPGGPEWVESLERVPAGRRHLAIHAGHLVEANEHDQVILEHASGLIGKFTTTGTPDEVRGRLQSLADRGVGEIAYQPAGEDIPRELEAFAAVASRLDHQEAAT